jgi:uncharacterized membrane protein YccC
MKAALAGLAVRWPEALRMTASGLLAFVASAWILHLPESQWAVLTALIVSRPDMRGAVGAGVGRLGGTVFGAAVAVLAAYGAAVHIPRIALLAAVLLPTSLLAVTNREYRTAPISALIVLSSGTIGGSAIRTAVFRTVEITLGSLVSLLVTLAFRPRSAARSLARILGVLPRIADLLGLVAGRTAWSRERWERLRAEIRAELRELGGAAASASRQEERERAQDVLRLVAALNSDILLLAHARRKAGRGLDLGPVADAFDAVTAALRSPASQDGVAKAGAFRAAVDAAAKAPQADTALWSVLLGHLADDVERLAAALGASGQKAD